MNTGDTVCVKKPTTYTPGITFAPDMHDYCGMLVTITKAYLNAEGHERYHIMEDNHRFVWCDEFFELINTSKEPYEYW